MVVQVWRRDFKAKIMDNKYLSTCPNVDDVEEIVKVHIAAFPSSFLSKLGPSFLFVFIKYMLKSSDVHLIILRLENEIVGYSAISRGDFSLWRGLAMQKPVSCFYYLTRVLINGSIKPLELLNRIRSNKDFVFGTWHLHSIAVLPSFQGKGIGKRLMQIVENYIDEISVGSFDKYSLSLTTNKLENLGAIGFYKRIGFNVESEATINNREMLLLIKKYD